MNFNERLNSELRFALELMPDGMAKGFTREFIGPTRISLMSQQREAFQAGHITQDPNVEISDHTVSWPAGESNIRVRIYKPKMSKGILPGVLYLHGGGYVMGPLECFDIPCSSYVNGANCVVVSPEYRLAPENPFPAGVEDCYTALEWLVANAGELGVDPNRIAVTGGSAGGGLTIALCLMARDRKGPEICFQMPLYPTMDDRLLTPSSKEITDDRVLNREACEGIWNLYLGEGHKEKEISPYAAPSRAMDLSGLPPAYSFVGELDPHRDETIDYITRLVQAGVPTGFTLYPGCYHGFDMMTPQAQISQHANNTSIQALKDALWRHGRVD